MAGITGKLSLIKNFFVVANYTSLNYCVGILVVDPAKNVLPNVDADISFSSNWIECLDQNVGKANSCHMKNGPFQVAPFMPTWHFSVVSKDRHTAADNKIVDWHF